METIVFSSMTARREIKQYLVVWPNVIKTFVIVTVQISQWIVHEFARYFVLHLQLLWLHDKRTLRVRNHASIVDEKHHTLPKETISIS